MSKVTRVLLAGFLAVSTVLATAPVALAGGTSGTDPGGTAETHDIMSNILNHRAHGVQRLTPYQSASVDNRIFDILGWSFAADAGKLTASVKVNSTWPKEMDSIAKLPPGVNSVDVRFMYRYTGMEQLYTAGQSCSGGSTPEGDGITGIDPIYQPITRDNFVCDDVTDGPYPVTPPNDDGWWLFASMEIRQVSGVGVTYDWSYGWFDEMNAIFFFFVGCGGKNADGTCKGGHNKIMQAEGTCATLCGTVTGQDTDTLTLNAPYFMRADLANDFDGLADETRTWVFLRPNTTVTASSVQTAGTAQVRVPDEPICLNPDDPASCVQTGVGLTFSADWAPGNPFDVSLPGSALQSGSPNWGSYIPRYYPRSRSWHPGAGAAFCNKPTGFLVDFGDGFSVGSQEINTFLTGMKIDHTGSGGETAYVKIMKAPQNDNGKPALVPVEAPVVDFAVPLALQPQACGHVFDEFGLHFLDATSDFSAS